MKFYSRWISALLRHVGPLKKLISKLAFLANLTPDTRSEKAPVFEPYTQSYDLQRRIAEISKLLRVERIVHPESKFARLGNTFDGGYVIWHDFSDTDDLISLGVGNDITFDTELSKFISKVHFYDHTVEDLPQPLDKAVFYREQIGYLNPGSITLEVALSRLNPKGNTILKMDIEGSEWEVLANTISLGIFKQIVIEFHGLQQLVNLENFVKIAQALQKLHKTHAPIHLHANNYAPVAVIGNCLVPDVIEVTYLNRTLYETAPFEPVPGSEFDSPNSSLSPDIALSFPLSTRFDMV